MTRTKKSEHMKTRIHIFCLLLCASAAFCLYGVVQAQPGTPDLSFNGTGYVVDTSQPAGSLNRYGFRLVTHPDFKTTVSTLAYTASGYITRIIRYNNDGSLDQGFGNEGYKDLDFNSKTFMAGLALQPDEKIVATGTTTEQGKLVCTTIRLNPDGSFDAGFGLNGIVTTHNMDSLEYACDVKVLSEGKLLVSGRLANQPDNHLFVVRYLPSGLIDTTFGSGGIATKTVPGCWFINFITLNILEDGKILLGGQVKFGIRSGIGLFRLLANGSTDTVFGQNGMVLDTAEYNKGLYQLITQSDGKIVVPTWVYTDATHYNYALIRYQANGSRDQSFANGGLYMGPGGFAYAVAMQTDGKIISAGGLKNDSTMLHATVARLLPSGIPDTTFGNNGFFEFNDSLPSALWDVRTDPSDRSIGTGYCNQQTNPTRKDVFTLRLTAFGVGVNDPPPRQTIGIRPNPFENNITLETPGLKGRIIEVFSIHGQRVESLKMEGETGCFYLGHLPAGLYFLKTAGNAKDRPVPVIKAN